MPGILPELPGRRYRLAVPLPTKLNTDAPLTPGGFPRLTLEFRSYANLIRTVHPTTDFTLSPGGKAAPVSATASPEHSAPAQSSMHPSHRRLPVDDAHEQLSGFFGDRRGLRSSQPPCSWIARSDRKPPVPSHKPNERLIRRHLRAGQSVSGRRCGNERLEIQTPRQQSRIRRRNKARSHVYSRVAEKESAPHVYRNRLPKQKLKKRRPKSRQNPRSSDTNRTDRLDWHFINRSAIDAQALGTNAQHERHSCPAAIQSHDQHARTHAKPLCINAQPRCTDAQPLEMYG